MKTQRSVLDMLQKHGLRSAYLILLLGCEYWEHFLVLHEERVPEPCRLPSDMLPALRDEFIELVGDIKRVSQADDARLMKEFRLACGSHELRQFYWERLVAGLNLPAREPRVEGEMHEDEVASGPKYWITTGSARKLRGKWRGVPVEIRVEISPRRTLLVTVSAELILTDAAVRTFLAEPFHPSLVAAKHDGKKSFVHKLLRGGLQQKVGYHGEDFLVLNAEGVAQLETIVREIGITDFKHD